MLRDLIGDKKAEEFLSELQSFMEDLQTLGWKELRPWSEFFGSFRVPEFTQSNIEEQIVTNFLFYRSNYAIMSLAILCLQILFSPVILLSFILVFGITAYLLFIHKAPIKVGDMKLTTLHKQYICAGTSAFILIITGTLTSLLWTFVYAVLLCGLHIVFRPRNLTSSANKVYEEMKLNAGGTHSVFQFATSAALGGGMDTSAITANKRKSEDPEDPAVNTEQGNRNYYQDEKAAGNIRKRY